MHLRSDNRAAGSVGNRPRGWRVEQGMRRVGIALLALGIAACGTAPALSPSPLQLNEGKPDAFAPSPGDDPLVAFAAALRTAGATVSEMGRFNTDPLGGRGTRLCVSGQQIQVYVYETSEERAAVARTIDPTDRSHVGMAIIEWRGDPTFWEADRLLVLYLGREQDTKNALTAVLGPPFASGRGRDPGPVAHAC